MKEPSNESEEMYLESIYVLSEQQERVCSVDIARYLGNARPTVSERLPKLISEGLVRRKNNSTNVELTEKGTNIAKRIYERHRVLSKVFKALGVNPDTAVEDACRIEHYISDETFSAVKKYYEEQLAKKAPKEASAHEKEPVETE